MYTCTLYSTLAGIQHVYMYIIYAHTCTSSLTYREEQLRAQGLDPSQFRESSSFNERCLHLDLECGIPRETSATATRDQSTEDSRTAVDGQPQTSHVDTVGVRGGRPAAGGVGVGGGCDVGGKDKDKDTPSSTPLPPSLGVPIVTHSKGSKEGNDTPYTCRCIIHYLSRICQCNFAILFHQCSCEVTF